MNYTKIKKLLNLWFKLNNFRWRPYNKRFRRKRKYLENIVSPFHEPNRDTREFLVCSLLEDFLQSKRFFDDIN